MRNSGWLGIALMALALLGAACDNDSPGSTSKGEGSAQEADDDSDDDDSQTDDDSAPSRDAGTSKTDAGKGKLDAGSTSNQRDGGKNPSGNNADGSQDSSPTDAGTSRSDAQLASVDASGNVPGSGAFPAVKDTGAKGPFTAKTVNNTGPQGGYTLYHPEELAPDGVPNPIVAWGNGGFTTPDLYPLLPHLASHGFVVIASNNMYVAGADVKAGIDWMIEQNEESSSDFYQKLETDNVAGVGYSLGGLANLEIADDPRLVTIVIISGANVSADLRTTNMPKLRTPIAYLCTDDADSKGNCAGDFKEANVPAFFGVVNGTDHFSVVLDNTAIGRLNMATTAWLRWQQMQDLSFKSTFVGDDCGLCTDSAWTVEPQKNLQ